MCLKSFVNRLSHDCHIEKKQFFFQILVLLVSRIILELAEDNQKPQK